MRKDFHLCCFVLLLIAIAGCSTARDVDGAQPESWRTIYVARRGWHTGVIVAAQDWPNRSWALLEEFPESDYLEFGWGDERFYQAEENSLWLGLRAALWPTSSVIHVIGLRAPFDDSADADEIVAVRVSRSGLRMLAEAVEREFAGARPIPSGSPLDAAPQPNGFYEARRRFYFPRMCNWWIAARLKEAGCPIQPWSVIAASRVVREARGFADDSCAHSARSGRTSRIETSPDPAH